MSFSIDARVPVRFGVADPAAAVLIEAGRPDQPGCVLVRFAVPAAAGHIAGCACCTPRGELAEALRRLFLARARGEVAFFRSVSVFAAAETEAVVRGVVRDDPMVAAWFRVASD
jgi:hypothetical protein